MTTIERIASEFKSQDIRNWILEDEFGDSHETAMDVVYYYSDLYEVETDEDGWIGITDEKWAEVRKLDHIQWFLGWIAEMAA